MSSDSEVEESSDTTWREEDEEEEEEEYSDEGDEEDGNLFEDASLYSTDEEEIMRYQPSTEDSLLQEVALLVQRIVKAEHMSSEANSNLTEEEAAILSKEKLLLWCRLAKIMQQEHKKAVEKYSSTLDYEEKGFFEKVARTIAGNDEFAELVEMRLLAEDPSSTLYLLASYISFLLVEGSRDTTLRERSTKDLIALVKDPNQVKRLAPLSLLFAAADQDESVIAEAIVEGVPQLLFHRLRTMFHFHPGGGPIAQASPLLSSMPPPPLSPPPFSPPSQQVLPPAALPPREERLQKGGSGIKRPREQAGWSFEVGEQVVRGPDWAHGDQDSGSLYGEVALPCTSSDYVVVRWVRSIFSLHRRLKPGQDFSRLFRYRVGTVAEVIPRTEEINQKYLDPSSINLKYEELLLSTAIIGVICTAKEAVLPALQEGGIELMIFLAEQESGEIVARALWVLNTLCTHRKLAVHFLELNGLDRVLKIARTTNVVAHRYGSALVLSQLSKPSIFEIIMSVPPTPKQTEQFQEINSITADNLRSPNPDLQGAACALYYSGLSFSMILAEFDKENGVHEMGKILESVLKETREKHDIVSPALATVVLKCLLVYVSSHLMLTVKPLLRKERRIVSLLSKPASRALPRDSRTVDTILAVLESNAADIAQYLIPSRVEWASRLLDSNLHLLLMEYGTHLATNLRSDMLQTTLQILRLLSVVPFARPAIADAIVGGNAESTPQRGISFFLAILDDFDYRIRENVLVCTRALECLSLLLQPPTTKVKEQIAAFNRACTLTRINNGIRVLLNLLTQQPPQETAQLLFAVAAHVVQILCYLASSGDTKQLFEALGVKKIVSQMSKVYSAIRPQATAANTQDHSDHPALAHFMENAKQLVLADNAGGLRGEMTDLFSDPFEAIERHSIVSRAHIEYSRESLLSLIANHLESEGLASSASALRSEACLQPSVRASPTLGALPSPGGRRSPRLVSSPLTRAPTPPPPTTAAHTLDGIVKGYLRLQHESCVAPISTMPKFDLLRHHQFLPPPPLVSRSHNLHNRLLTRRTSIRQSMLSTPFSRKLLYSSSRIVFDIRGGDRGLSAQCITFLDEGNTIAVGTSEGGIAIFDTSYDIMNGEKLLEQQILFDSDSVMQLAPSPSGNWLAATSSKQTTSILPRHTLPSITLVLPETKAATFSFDDKFVLATPQRGHVLAKLHDIEREGVVVTEFIDPDGVSDSEHNSRNVASLHPNGPYLLSDALLWDVRAPTRPVLRFDRIAENFANCFHSNGFLVLVDDSVWDLRRAEHLMLRCPYLSHSFPSCTRNGEAIYAWVVTEEPAFTSSSLINVIDSGTFSLMNSFSLRQTINAFALDPFGRHYATLVDTEDDSYVKVFGIGVTAAPQPEVFGSEEGEGPGEKDSEKTLGSDSFSSYDDDDFEEDEEDEDEEDEEGDDGIEWLATGHNHHGNEAANAEDEDEEEEEGPSSALNGVDRESQMST